MEGGSRARRPKVAHCEGSVSLFFLICFMFTHAHARTQPFGGGGSIPQLAQ